MTKGVVFTLSLSMLLASLGTSIVNIALPALAEAFSAPFAEVQAVVVIYLAAMTVSVVIAGRLGDRFGLKPMLQTGLGLFCLASFASAFAQNLWWLIAARALQGIGAAFLMTLSMALMRQMASQSRIGRAMGLLGTVSAGGPSLGGLLIPVAGWQGIFWLQIPFTAIALLLAVVILPDDVARKQTVAASMRSVFNADLVASLVINLLVAAVMMTTLVVGPFYLGLRLELQINQIGFVMAIGPLLSIISGVPSGRLVDVWGSRRVLSLGLILLAAGAFLLAFLPNTIGLVGYIASIILLTPGYQLFQAANNTAALADVPREQRGTAFGVLTMSRNIGLITGASIMGVVFSAGVGTENLADATSEAIGQGMQLVFLFSGAMMIAAIAANIAAGRRRWESLTREQP
ncbi:MFS transporter [Rhizobium sp. BIGb0125]|uniref:MFS transporter n=1 Tax=Rhizobium sp. BIGb0125 TaxID=2940618 RepID=UPI002166D59B|nr:MFS transporter [Rhizobium sp. BIGb0125]